jgi:hypothetical protein
MLHQRGLAGAGLALEPENAVVVVEAVAATPLAELGSGKKPVAGSGEGRIDIVPAGAESGKGQRAQTIWTASA